VPPIGPYPVRPAQVAEWDPQIVDVHRRVAALINARRPDLRVEHTGSSAVPDLPGKNVLDLGIETDPDDVPAVAAWLEELGFQRQSNPNAFPPTRPLMVGSIEHRGAVYRIHAHVLPRGHRVYVREHRRDLAFRDALRSDARLRGAYAARKREIVADGPVDGYRYSMAKTEWIRSALDELGLADPPLVPPATIGILGGGQLGRMLGSAARTLGYGVVVLDPDPRCPAAAIADRVIVARYDDVDAALEMASTADVVTYELEHVSSEVVRRLDWDWPVRPGVYPLAVTQDRLAERRFLESETAKVAPWRAVHDEAGLEAAAAELGFPLRVKAAFGGYDGRSQVRIAEPGDVAGALDRLGRADGEPLVVERELDFAAELSVVCSRGIDGRTTTFPVAMNRHDEGILVESWAPAAVPSAVSDEAARLVRRLAEGMDLVGTLTAELFQLRDGSLAVNELAPRVHNTGHWTVEACRTSQFEQHIRAICGLPLGAVDQLAPAGLVNLLGSGSRREARPTGIERALTDPAVSVHVYGKREVFARRKMGHVTAIDPAGPERALARAREAAGRIGWA
jgi:5-(carboxyamino)imidazole ribonucleotide synthase